MKRLEVMVALEETLQSQETYERLLKFQKKKKPKKSTLYRRFRLSLSSFHNTYNHSFLILLATFSLIISQKSPIS